MNGMTQPELAPVVFPSGVWQPADDLEAIGIDPEGWESFRSALNIRGANWEGEDHSGNQWGVVVTCRGRVIGSWGDPNYGELRNQLHADGSIAWQ